MATIYKDVVYGSGHVFSSEEDIQISCTVREAKIILNALLLFNEVEYNRNVNAAVAADIAKKLQEKL